MRGTIKIVSRISCSLFLVLFLFSLASAQPDRLATDKISARGGYQALSDKTDRGENVRLIVKVRTPFKPMSDVASTESRQQMDSISSAQDALLSELSSKRPRAHHKYRYIPYIFMEVDGPALQALMASPLVERIHEDVPKRPHLNLSVPRIGAPSMWPSGYTGSGVAVAVIDTGVDKNHPFLTGAVVSEACYSTTSAIPTGDPDNPWTVESVCPDGVASSTEVNSAMPYGGVCPVPTGECDHGTHVSGIIAGRQSVGGSPGPGVAPGAGIIAIQVFSRFNLDADCGGAGSAPCVMSYTSDMIKGLERVYDLRSTFTIASVNMSLGGDQYFNTAECDAAEAPTKTAIDNLKAAGIATVASSGNNGYCDSMGAPGCISSAVSVGATTDSDTVANYSNNASFLSLLAPGSSINSSVPGDTYESWNGTSMAAPHVSGAWALLKQARPGSTADQILSALATTGLSVTNTRCGSVTKKRINVNSALSTLQNGPIVTTDAADGIDNNAATLHGTVNANGANTSVTFEYGTTTAYGSTVAVPGTVSGSSNTPVSASVTGLTANTFYHFRVKAVNSGGTSYGSDMTFSTTGPCGVILDGSFEDYESDWPGGYPWEEFSTNFFTPVCNLTLCGNGGGTAGPRTGSWWAWYGGTSLEEEGWLKQIATVPVSGSPRLEFYLWNGASSGNGSDVFSATVDGSEIFSTIEGNSLFTGGYTLVSLDLSPYADGSTHTLGLESFTTGSTNFSVDDVSMSCVTGKLPAVTTGTAVYVPGTGVTLNGSINAYGSNASAIFDYGTTIAYGSTATAAPSPVSGNTNTPVSATITSLTPGATYHYRLRGQNSFGIAYGLDGTFPPICTSAEAKIGGTNYNANIVLAVSSAINGNEIRANTAIFTGNPIFMNNGNVTLKGGFDCAFSLNPNFSTIDGSITFRENSTVVIENIAVQ